MFNQSTNIHRPVMPAVYWILCLCWCSYAVSQETTPSVRLSESELRSIIGRTQPSYPGGLTSLPSWAKDLPFEYGEYFELPDEENRAIAYLDAFTEFSGDSLLWYPTLDAKLFERRSREQAQRAAALSKFLDRRLNSRGQMLKRLSQREQAAARELLLPLEVGFQKLSQVGDRSQCFFRSDWLPSSLSPGAFTTRQVLTAQVLHCQTLDDSAELIKTIDLVFQMQRDFSQLSQTATELACISLGRRTLDEIVKPLLINKETSPELLQELSVLLIEHDVQCRIRDPYLESAKREIVELLHVMHLLQTGQLVTKQRLDYLDLDGESSMATVVLREIVDYGFFELNTDWAETEVRRAAGKDERISELAKAVLPDDDSELSDEAARMLISMWLSLDDKNDEQVSFQKDRSVLEQRFRLVQAACAKDYPESTSTLDRLSSGWVDDNSWQETRLIKWFLPRRSIAEERALGQLWRSAYLCLIALQHWRLTHDNGNPPDLAIALEEIGVVSVPVDPFSDRSLQMITDGDETGVYSWGVDGRDDRADREYMPGYVPLGENPGRRGDIMFWLGK